MTEAQNRNQVNNKVKIERKAIQWCSLCWRESWKAMGKRNKNRCGRCNTKRNPSDGMCRTCSPGIIWRYAEKGTWNTLARPNWSTSGWKYVDHQLWSKNQLKEDRTRSNCQFRVAVKKRQEIWAGIVLLRISNVKVQVTQYREKMCKLEHCEAGILAREFTHWLVEVLIAGYVVWSTCDAFSKNAKLRWHTQYV